MHRDLRDMLSLAKGEFRYVVVANVDIRGFTSFFADSIKAAAFLSKAYTRILSDYFPDVSFFKPTGDGLLLIKEVDDADEELLKATISAFIASSLKLSDEFHQICSPSIRMNWPKPQKVGIGIAWGDATRIHSGPTDKTLDFSGKPLNLASRLMDLGRPFGVVFGDEIQPNFVRDDLMAKFNKETVYIRGISEQNPMEVFVTHGIDIPYANRRPFGTEPYRSQPRTYTLKEVENMGPHFKFALQFEPSSFKSVQLYVQYPGMNLDRTPNLGVEGTLWALPTKVVPEMEKLIAIFDFAGLVKRLARFGVKEDDRLSLTVTYDVALGTQARSAPSDIRTTESEQPTV